MKIHRAIEITLVCSSVRRFLVFIIYLPLKKFTVVNLHWQAVPGTQREGWLKEGYGGFSKIWWRRCGKGRGGAKKTTAKIAGLFLCTSLACCSLQLRCCKKRKGPCSAVDLLRNKEKLPFCYQYQHRNKHLSALCNVSEIPLAHLLQKINKVWVYKFTAPLSTASKFVLCTVANNCVLCALLAIRILIANSCTRLRWIFIRHSQDEGRTDKSLRRAL
jgi:hypothetical protein